MHNTIPNFVKYKLHKTHRLKELSYSPHIHSMNRLCGVFCQALQVRQHGLWLHGAYILMRYQNQEVTKMSGFKC